MSIPPGFARRACRSSGELGNSASRAANSERLPGQFVKHSRLSRPGPPPGPRGRHHSDLSRELALPEELPLVELAALEDRGPFYRNEGTSMKDIVVTLNQVVNYCQEHELLLRLLGIAEGDVIRDNSAMRRQMEEDNKRKAIDDQTRRAIDELVRIGILRKEVNQDQRALFPGELWGNRLAILQAREEA